MRILSIGYLSKDCCNLVIFGAPERIRTSGLCLRRAALYPAELRVHLWRYKVWSAGIQLRFFSNLIVAVGYSWKTILRGFLCANAW